MSRDGACLLLGAKGNPARAGAGFQSPSFPGARTCDASAVLDGVIVASLISNGDTHNAVWTAELLENLAPEQRPKPFAEIEHTFRSLEDVRAWLGDADIRNAGREG